MIIGYILWHFNIIMRCFSRLFNAIQGENLWHFKSQLYLSSLVDTKNVFCDIAFSFVDTGSIFCVFSFTEVDTMDAALPITRFLCPSFFGFGWTSAPLSEFSWKRCLSSPVLPVGSGGNSYPVYHTQGHSWAAVCCKTSHSARSCRWILPGFYTH